MIISLFYKKHIVKLEHMSLPPLLYDLINKPFAIKGEDILSSTCKFICLVKIAKSDTCWKKILVKCIDF